MSDSWEHFIQAVDAETQSMERLHEAAVSLTRALVKNDSDQIRVASHTVEEFRKAHQSHAGQRRSMQRRGFGRLTLRDVCGYAPRNFNRHLQIRLSQLHYYVSALQITNENNRALVVAGMDRLLQIVDVLRDAGAEESGIYRRRGIEKKKDGSVIVSQQA